MRRAAGALIVVVLAMLLGACSDSDAVFPEDLRGEPTNSFKDEPEYVRANLLVDPWVRRIPVNHGRSTFGREITKIVRLEVDGRGPLTRREVSLQTAPTVALFEGERRQRMQRLVQGTLTWADERRAFIRGINLSSSLATYEASAIAQIVEEYAIDGNLTRFERDFIEPFLVLIARELAEHAYAWFDPRTTWVNFGPDVSNTLRRHATHPKRVSARDGIFAAHVIVHELEHAVTPPKEDDYLRWRWVEEGTADVFARWPGAAATAAKQLGLPYPKRYLTARYKPHVRGGYPEWAETFFVLLPAAGVDTSRLAGRTEASRILQSQPRLPVALDRLAAAIATEQGLSGARAAKLRRDIRAVNGNPTRARAIVADWV